VVEPLEKRREELNQRYGVIATAELRSIKHIDILILAIKPQIFERVAAEVGSIQQPCPLVISILAGVKLGRLEVAFPHCPVIRAMPNTPATVGAGVTAIALGQRTQAHHREQAVHLFQAIGEVVEVSEDLMDAVTGLSGSGPAYVALMIEALADGGVAAGLPRAIAQKLAVQTVLGTAQLLHRSGSHPAELKDRVASPGGTTIAGIAALEQAGFRGALMKAVQAAAQRSKELS
jgi:pyrroline-5-carboxylate reductase